MECTSYYSDFEANILSINGLIDKIRKFDLLKSKKPDLEVELIQSKFKSEVDYFHLQPHLLDRDIHDFVTKLLQIVTDCRLVVPLDRTKYNLSFTCIYSLANVRGFKKLIRHLPHEVSDVEPVMKMLQDENPNDQSNFETKYILILWLSVLVMIPLDLRRFDASGDEMNSLSNRIYRVIQDHLSSPFDMKAGGGVAAPFLAARFLTRPEIEASFLDDFISWCLNNVLSVETAQVEVTRQLRALFYLFKIGPRHVLSNHGPKILKTIEVNKLTNLKDEILQKVIVKLVQRIGLSFLKTKIAPWRYQRGKRSIADQIAVKKNEQESQAASNPSQIVDEEMDDDEDVPEELENVIEFLLNGLRSNSRAVQWSAAKGIGRICNRLPKELASSVLDSILAMFSPRESGSSWHSGCLAIAELGRRGLILPNELPRVFQVVKKALIYDEFKGCHSIGSDVRDAACYVCWAFSRAYDVTTMSTFVTQMASSLIITSLFDREVNCRRAAAAAFQENVGRQGSFPNGIDIVTTIDYMSVGLKKDSFGHLVSFISEFESYHQPLIEHLLQHKIGHWDPEIRVLASNSLRILCSNLGNESRVIEQLVIPSLIEHSLSFDLNSRHGSLVSMAQIVRCHQETKKILPGQFVDHIRGLVHIYEQKKYFSSFGSELMREGFCELINESSKAKVSLVGHELVIISWFEVIKSSIFYVKPEIRTFGVKCLSSFALEYLIKDDKLREELFEEILNHIRDLDQGIRCGSFEAMASLPPEILPPSDRIALMNITINYILSEKSVDKSMTEARAAALTAVTNFLIKLSSKSCKEQQDEAKVDFEGETRKADEGKGPESPQSPSSAPGNPSAPNSSLTPSSTLSSVTDENLVPTQLVAQVFKCLVSGTSDFTSGSRGDIGLVVRKASILGIRDLSLHMVANGLFSSIFNEKSFLDELFNCIARLCVTSNELMRVTAAQVFTDLLQGLNQESKNLVPHLTELGRLVQGKELRTPKNVLEVFIQLLPFGTFTRQLWLGLLTSCGSIAIGTRKEARLTVGKFLKDLRKKEVESYKKVFHELLRLFEELWDDARLSPPLLKTYEWLTTGGFLDNLGDEYVKQIVRVTFKAIKPADVSKKIDGAALLCSSLQFEGCFKFTLNYIVVLLCSPSPPVRVAVAEKLQVSLLTFGHEVISGDNLEIETAIEILRETNWNQAVNSVRSKRDLLCDLLKIKRPVLQQKKT